MTAHRLKSSHPFSAVHFVRTWRERTCDGKPECACVKAPNRGILPPPGGLSSFPGGGGLKPPRLDSKYFRLWRSGPITETELTPSALVKLATRRGSPLFHPGARHEKSPSRL